MIIYVCLYPFDLHCILIIITDFKLQNVLFQTIVGKINILYVILIY